MIALRIGLLAVDGITLENVTPIRDRLEALGVQVTLVVPSGGSILPVTGRYYPAAGGHGVRCPLNQVAPGEFHALLLPDGITAEQLTACEKAMWLIRGETEDDTFQPVPVFTVSFLQHLLDRGGQLEGLAQNGEAVLSCGPRSR